MVRFRQPEKILASTSNSSAIETIILEEVLRNFKKFTGKHLCQSLFFNKVAGLRPATLLKKRLWHRCFPVNFVKFLRTPFLQNTSDGCFDNTQAKGFLAAQVFLNNFPLM